MIPGNVWRRDSPICSAKDPGDAPVTWGGITPSIVTLGRQRSWSAVTDHGILSDFSPAWSLSLSLSLSLLRLRVECSHTLCLGSERLVIGRWYGPHTPSCHLGGFHLASRVVDQDAEPYSSTNQLACWPQRGPQVGTEFRVQFPHPASV